MSALLTPQLPAVQMGFKCKICREFVGQPGDDIQLIIFNHIQTHKAGDLLYLERL